MATAAKPVTRLHFSVDIAATRDKVWRVLWDDKTFRDWSSVFAEGSYAESDWNEGSAIRFIDPSSDSGMSSVIEKKRPGEFMSFRHDAEIKNGKVQPAPEWSGAHENYTLTANDGRTRLTVDLDAPEEYRQMFEDKFPQALARVKKLSETASVVGSPV
jgi:uncharacterized protein YndB with AHSA1/START domain